MEGEFKWLGTLVVVLRVAQVLIVALLGALGERATEGAVTQLLGVPPALGAPLAAEPYGSSLNMQPVLLLRDPPSRSLA